MACMGPTVEEERQADKCRKLYKLILGIIEVAEEQDDPPFAQKWVIEGCKQGVKECRQEYGNEGRFQSLTRWLCKRSMSLTTEQKGVYMYNGYDSRCRRYADWWGDHQKEDVERRAKETRKKAEILAEDASKAAYNETYVREHQRLSKERHEAWLQENEDAKKDTAGPKGDPGPDGW